MKSRSVTPDPSSTVGEKSKEFADKALNLINPGRCVSLHTLENETIYFYCRKYEQRRRNLQQALAWWEDEDLNPDRIFIDFRRRKIFFDERKFILSKRRSSLDSSLR